MRLTFYADTMWKIRLAQVCQAAGDKTLYKARKKSGINKVCISDGGNQKLNLTLGAAVIYRSSSTFHKVENICESSNLWCEKLE